MANTQSHRGAYLSIVIARRPQADAAIYAEVPLATSRWIAPVDLGAAARLAMTKRGVLKFIKSEATDLEP